MSDPKQKAALRMMVVGVGVAAVGAAVIWGPGGIPLVFGIFIAAMSAVEYWKAV